MKRTPVARRTPLTRRPFRSSPAGPTRIRRSPQPPAVSPDWQAIREALYARAGGRCERCSGLLDVSGMDAHHRKLRSRGVDHSLSNLAALCPSDHRWVHDQPLAATGHGLMVPSWADPAQVPLRLNGGRLVLLTNAGGYVDAADAVGQEEWS